MRLSPLHAIALAALYVPMSAFAQPQGPQAAMPRLDNLTPCGGKFGTTVEVTIAGADLDDVKELRFNHTGLKAELIEAPEPKPDPKAAKEPKGKNKAAKQGGKFKVSIDAAVKPGMVEAWVVNRFGVSNPRAFIVGDLNEIAEVEPNNDADKFQKIELNATVNGGFASPTDVDYYQFAGKKGQRVIASCRTASIDSRSRPLLEIFSPEGKPLAASRNYDGDEALADATLPTDGDYLVRVCEFTYTFAQNAAPNQYYYRLTVSTGPWIDAIFPPMVQPGKPAQVTVLGRNLPGGKASSPFRSQGRELEQLTVTVTPPAEGGKLDVGFRVDPRSAELDAFPFSLPGSNTVPIFLAKDQVVAEKQGNDTLETAQEVPLNVEVAGRLDNRGDRDWYKFTAKKGDTVWIDLWSDRLHCNAVGAQAFMYFTLKKADPKAGAVVEQEEANDTLSPNHFFTRNGDPPGYRFAVPEDGTYAIMVGSREAATHFGPKADYRLCVSTGSPDFRVVALAPYSSNALPQSGYAARDGNSYFDVYVFRRHGFKEPIKLTAEGLPPGVECPPQMIGSDQRTGVLVLKTKADAADFTGLVQLTATATVNGTELRRPVRMATITWAGPQNNPNFPLISRLNGQTAFAVRDKTPFRITVDPAKVFLKKDEKLGSPIVVKPSDKLTFPFTIERANAEAKVQITVTAVNPAGRGNQNQQGPLLFQNGQAIPPVAPDKDAGAMSVDIRSTAAPGIYPVVLKATAQVPYTKNADGTDKKPTLFTAISEPVMVQVLPASLGRFEVKPAGNAKAGQDYEVVVKVSRENDFTGPFLLSIAGKGPKADETVIPTGKDEAKMVLKIPADAKAGMIPNLVLEAKADYEGKYPIKHEAKFSVTVGK